MKYEIRRVDRNTVILWVNCGYNLFFYATGLSLDIYKKIVDFEKGIREFKDVQSLYEWALNIQKERHPHLYK